MSTLSFPAQANTLPGRHIHRHSRDFTQQPKFPPTQPACAAGSCCSHPCCTTWKYIYPGASSTSRCDHGRNTEARQLWPAGSRMRCRTAKNPTTVQRTLACLMPIHAWWGHRSIAGTTSFPSRATTSEPRRMLLPGRPSSGCRKTVTLRVGIPALRLFGNFWHIALWVDPGSFNSRLHRPNANAAHVPIQAGSACFIIYTLKQCNAKNMSSAG